MLVCGWVSIFSIKVSKDHCLILSLFFLDAFAAVMDEEEHSPLRSPVGDPGTPYSGGGVEVGPPLTLIKFEPLSLSTEVSPASHVDLRLISRHLSE